MVSAQLEEFNYDDTDYPDSPENDYAKIREVVSFRFPELGFYCTGDGQPEEIDKAEILAGDAIDDLVDIIGDLQEVLWCLKGYRACCSAGTRVGRTGHADPFRRRLCLVA